LKQTTSGLQGLQTLLFAYCVVDLATLPLKEASLQFLFSLSARNQNKRNSFFLSQNVVMVATNKLQINNFADCLESTGKSP
jgi:hypothetical protein